MNEVKSLLDRVYESFMQGNDKASTSESKAIINVINDTINKMSNVEFLDLISFELQHMFYDATKAQPTFSAEQAKAGRGEPDWRDAQSFY